jgi:hypothetical protein
MHLSTTPRSVRVIPFLPVTFPQLVNFPDHPGAMFPRQERTLLRFSISKHAALPAHPDNQMKKQQVIKQSIRAVCRPHRTMPEQLAAPRPFCLRSDAGPILLPRRYPASALEGQRSAVLDPSGLAARRSRPLMYASCNIPLIRVRSCVWCSCSTRRHEGRRHTQAAAYSKIVEIGSFLNKPASTIATSPSPYCNHKGGSPIYSGPLGACNSAKSPIVGGPKISLLTIRTGMQPDL